MSWDAYLDHVDAVAVRVRRALSAGDALTAAAAVAELEDDRNHLPPMPPHIADRARLTIRQLASLDAAVHLAMSRLEPELSLLERARPASGSSQYVDTSA